MGSLADNASGGYYAYRASKAALNMCVRSFAIDRPELITVAMHPGWVQTDMGGQQAPLTVQESVASLLRVIFQLKPTDTGTFKNYDGSTLPW
jgi:NAD(P)-dependent dehydrogenase (short-subunit alcohol dehydrogenase family)